MRGSGPSPCSGKSCPTERDPHRRDRRSTLFGEPLRRQAFDKRGGDVLGPIEAFWPAVPAGSTVEVWVYRVEGGAVELYFVDGSARVQGRGFAPEGAVFEAGSSQRTTPE